MFYLSNKIYIDKSTFLCLLFVIIFKTMRNYIFLGLILTMSSIAEDAVINLATIESRMQKVKDISTFMSSKENEIKKDIDTKKEKIEAKAQKLTQNKQNIAQETFMKEIKKIEDEYRDLQAYANEQGRRFDFIKQSFLRNFEEVVTASTAKVARSKKVDKVFTTSSLIYYNKDALLDITEDTIKESANALESIKPDSDFKKYDKEYKKSQK